MLAEQAFCPISPAPLMCEPGLSCVAVDNHRNCDMDNVSPLMGNLLGRKTAAIHYTPLSDENEHDLYRRSGRVKREALSFTPSTIPPEISSTPLSELERNASIFAKIQRDLKRHYVMRPVATNDIFCRCHKLFNCLDNTIECKADCLALNFLLGWFVVLSMTRNYLL